MILYACNIRRLNKPFKQKEFKSFLLQNNVVVIGYLETKIKAGGAEKIKRKLGIEWKVSSNYLYDPTGRIWV